MKLPYAALESNVKTLIRWAGLVMIARYAYLAIESLAGEITLADISLDAAANFCIYYVIPTGAAAFIVAIIYGFLQNRLRKRTIKRMGSRIRKLEISKDPDRSSSEITTTGETREEDEV